MLHLNNKTTDSDVHSRQKRTMEDFSRWPSTSSKWPMPIIYKFDGSHSECTVVTLFSLFHFMTLAHLVSYGTHPLLFCYRLISFGSLKLRSYKLLILGQFSTRQNCGRCRNNSTGIFLPTLRQHSLWLRCQRNEVAPYSECKWNIEITSLVSRAQKRFLVSNGNASCGLMRQYIVNCHIFSS